MMAPLPRLKGQRVCGCRWSLVLSDVRISGGKNGVRDGPPLGGQTAALMSAFPRSEMAEPEKLGPVGHRCVAMQSLDVCFPEHPRWCVRKEWEPVNVEPCGPPLRGQSKS